MKISLFILLLLIGVVSANTSVLGSHDVSVNLSVPAVYAVETPIYDSTSDMWTYILNITPNTGGSAYITLNELNSPVYNSAMVKNFADYAVKSTSGFGNVKYGMITYQGHDAFEISYPAQVVAQSDGSSETLAEFHGLVFMPDPVSRVLLDTLNTGDAVYKEIFNSLKISKNMTKSTNAKESLNPLPINPP